jgi:glyoxylase-like metal-dependent hydrolase (beta-lactamase superfamily II)
MTKKTANFIRATPLLFTFLKGRSNMTQLTPHIHGVLTAGGYLNGYLVENNGTFTLVDAGQSDSFVAAVEGVLNHLGKSIQDIKRIFITHAHSDHIGALAKIQTLSNATTYAHRIEAKIIRGEASPTYANENELGFFSRLILSQIKARPLPIARVERELGENDTLNEIAPNAKVVFLPGHTHGQLGLYVPEDSALIAGDVMMHYPWGLGMPLRPVSPDWNAVKASIQRVAELNPTHLMLGHGQPIMGDAGARVKAFSTKIK